VWGWYVPTTCVPPRHQAFVIPRIPSNPNMPKIRPNNRFNHPPEIVTSFGALLWRRTWTSPFVPVDGMMLGHRTQICDDLIDQIVRKLNIGLDTLRGEHKAGISRFCSVAHSGRRWIKRPVLQSSIGGLSSPENVCLKEPLSPFLSVIIDADLCLVCMGG